jgi:hypothetical protein
MEFVLLFAEIQKYSNLQKNKRGIEHATFNFCRHFGWLCRLGNGR